VANGCAGWLHIFLFTVGIMIMFEKDRTKTKTVETVLMYDLTIFVIVQSGIESGD